MLTLTEKAADRITIIRKEKNVSGGDKLRLAIVGGGCSGFSYKLGSCHGCKFD